MIVAVDTGDLRLELQNNPRVSPWVRQRLIQAVDEIDRLRAEAKRLQYELDSAQETSHVVVLRAEAAMRRRDAEIKRLDGDWHEVIASGCRACGGGATLRSDRKLSGPDGYLYHWHENHECEADR